MSEEKSERVIGEQTLGIPYKENELQISIYIATGRSYWTVRDQLLKEKNRLPTPEETITILNVSYNSKNKEFEEHPTVELIREFMGGHHCNFIGFNRNIWTVRGVKNAGVYVISEEKWMDYIQKVIPRIECGHETHNEEVNNLYKLMELLESELIGSKKAKEVIFSEDGEVRFAPYSTFKEGKQNWEFSDNGFFIANFGVDGIEPLENLASVFGRPPNIYGAEVDSIRPYKTFLGISSERAGLDIYSNPYNHNHTYSFRLVN